MNWDSLAITQLLASWRGGEINARDRLVEALYPMLMSQARIRLMRISPGSLSLSATDLAHETYLRLSEQRGGFANRSHFLAITAQTLRRVLADLLRDRKAHKRGGDDEIISLSDVDLEHASPANSLDLADLLQSLELLERRDSVAASVIELRFFGGLSAAETAESLGIGVATANRHFAFARAWLFRRHEK